MPSDGNRELKEDSRMTTTPQTFQRSRRASDRQNTTIKLVETHWRDLLQRADVPARHDMKPNAIAGALPSAFVVERVAPGVARIRVAGQRLHDLMGMDIRGMPLSAFINADDQATFAVHLEAAFSDPALIALPLKSESRFIRKDIREQIILLPMADSKGDVTRVLGAMSFHSPIKLRSRQFRLDDSKPMRHEPIYRRQTPTVRITRKPDATDVRPALRLVVNNA